LLAVITNSIEGLHVYPGSSPEAGSTLAVMQVLLRGWRVKKCIIELKQQETYSKVTICNVGRVTGGHFRINVGKEMVELAYCLVQWAVLEDTESVSN